MSTIAISGPIPGAKSKALLERRSRVVAPGVSLLHPIFVERAHGSTVTDVDGNTFLDFTGGIGVLNIGHTHDDVAAAVAKQVRQLTHTCFQVTGYEPYVAVAEALVRLAPGDFDKRVFLVSSGAEAIENAVKIARGATKRGAVLCFEHAFHGRTLLGMTLTGKAVPYKAGFGPYAPEVYRLPYPYPYRGLGMELVPAAGDTPDGSRIEKALKTVVRPQDLAAVIIEPVLGEGGFLAAPPAFLQELRAFCDKYGIVFIADEVQTGFARTGEMFACEALGVVPDLMCVAKSIAGGMPLAAVVGKASIVDQVGVGGLGGTYAGNPVSCAAALAAIAVIESQGLVARAAALGSRLRTRLSAMAEKLPLIGEVRGVGAMVAIELVRDRKTREPADKETQAAIAWARDRGLLLLGAGTYGNVIRFLMPLTISDAELDEGLAIVEAALAAVRPG
jgi:4-aminobutyrate aminotransferase / (S)-3-amino-2-methylpropionate transaminase / 5-aminovalerate transaminase